MNNSNSAPAISALADVYMAEYERLMEMVKALKPLTCTYTGEELLLVRRKIRIYYDMALEAKATAEILNGYIKKEDK